MLVASVAVAGTALLRRPLLAAALTALMHRAGANEVTLDVTQASPWFVEVKDLGFNYQAQRVDARSVTVSRAHWRQRSLGTVHAAGLRVPVALDGSAPPPWALLDGVAGGGGGEAKPTTGDPQPIPAEAVSFDGVFVLKFPDAPAEELTVEFAATLGENFKWSGTLKATAPGLSAEITGDYDFPSSAARFEVIRSQLDLAHWQGLLQQFAPLPGGVWQMAGTVTATGAGTYAGDQLAAGAQVQLRDGRFVHPTGMPVAEGVTADFRFSDVLGLVSEPGLVRVRAVDAGEIKAANLEAEIALVGPEQLHVNRATLEALGGRVSLEPFVLFPARDDFEVTLVVDGLVVEQVLALTKDLPAKATGRVDGRLPLRYDSNGLRLGTGWLELKRGAPAELQFNASGLLTSGVAPKHPSYPTLKKIESGLLRLNLTELRLDIRPPNSPSSRSATLRIVGAPVDPQVKAPVSLDLNVNGPIEQLLNLGMDGRIKFATGR